MTYLTTDSLSVGGFRYQKCKFLIISNFYQDKLKLIVKAAHDRRMIGILLFFDVPPVVGGR
jgi:hypothetical protein